MGSSGVGLPSGSVTFLFTDIESSTRLLSSLGSAYDELLDLHHATLRRVWDANQGFEVSVEGDGFFVAFASADDAVQAAVDAQRSLATATWPGDVAPRVRIGMHTGYAMPRNDDYIALAVNQAARVLGAAHGGQILLTELTRSSLTREPDAPVRSRGHFRVRDFDGPQELFGVEADGWIDPGRPPRVRPADGHNLVAPLGVMVDRFDEREWLRTTVEPGVIATIVGPGGGGKTRLVVEFGLEQADSWPDGVWFVDLSSVRSDDHVAEAVATAVGASPTPGAPVIEDVRSHLRDREALLLLDNCEQVVDAAATIVHDLLVSCRSVGVAATSRVPLGLRSERLLRLSSLPFDGHDSPAVELFLATAPDIHASDIPTVRDLCEQLDGLPLALELAAVRTRTVAPGAILERLHQDPGIIHSRDPTRPDRHRSIERVLDWSWELLDRDARTVLRRLAVLSGSFSQHTAIVASSDEGLPADAVVELLWTLVDHSLVLTDQAAGESRYRVATPVRSHASARSESAEHTATVRRLAHHFHTIFGPTRVGTRAWAGSMATELDNVRGIVHDLAGHDDALGQSLAWAIGSHLDLINAYATCIAEIGTALERFPTETANRVGLLTLKAYVHLRMGDVDDAEPVLDEASRIAARVGTPDWDEACLVRARGEVALRRGDAAAAVEIASVALASVTDQRSRSRLFNLIGLASAEQGDVERALRSFDEELAAARLAGLETSLAKTHGNIAEAASQLGDRVRAARHQLECLEAARANGEPVLVAYSVMLAARLLATGSSDPADLVAAARLHESALHALRLAGHVLYTVDAEVGDELRSGIVAGLGSEAYEAAAVVGRSLDLATVAQLANDVLEGVINQEE